MYLLTGLLDIRFRDSRYIGTTLVCGRFGSRVFISKILTCSFCSRLFSDVTCYTWTITAYLAENYELAEDFYGGEAD